MNYFFDVWSAFSHLLNTIIGGKPCETLSGRAFRTDSWVQNVINTVFFFQDNHCLEAHLSDVYDANWLVTTVSKPVSTPDEVTAVADYTDTPEVRDAAWFWSQPFDDQIMYVENGEWIRNGLTDFFAMQWDDTVPAETRRRIAKAYAHRYGMPYSDPTVKNKTPTGLGMGDDGNQR